MMRRVVRALLLAVVYVAATGSATVWDAGIGLAIGASLSHLGLRERTRGAWTMRRLAAVPRLAAGIVLELARGTGSMLLVLIGVRSWRRVGTVEVEAGPRSARASVLSGFVATASPGSVLIDLPRDDGTGRRLIVNVIDAGAPSEVREDLDRFYRRYQRRAVP